VRRLACAALGLAAVGVAGAACDGQKNSYVFTEPLRVANAQFFAGDLPGSPPIDPDAGAPAPGGGPTVTAITAQNTVVYSGEGGKALGGRATDNATAVALRFADIGTGYWLLPLGNPDPLFPGELSWSAVTDFNPNVPPGKHPLRVVALDGNGVAGAQSEQVLCVASRIPNVPGATTADDVTACYPSQNPAEAVFTLHWDADVDLDLHVITPDGNDVSAKHPLASPVDAGAQPPLSDPRVDRDSLARCVPDGWRQEDLVFPNRPASGSVYEIHANLFDACGKPSVDFVLTVYEPEGTLGQDRHLVQTYQQAGRLTSFDADGNAVGLFIADYPF
jgi:hypothetical protein